MDGRDVLICIIMATTVYEVGFNTAQYNHIKTHADQNFYLVATK